MLKMVEMLLANEYGQWLLIILLVGVVFIAICIIADALERWLEQ